MYFSFLTHVSNFSVWLEKITQPEHPHHRYVQICLFTGLAAASTACLTSISPKKTAALFFVAYSISLLAAPIIQTIFEPYRNHSLAPLTGQLMLYSFSLLSAKMICSIIHQSLSFKEIKIVCTAFLLSLFITYLVLRIFRQKIIYSADKYSSN